LVEVGGTALATGAVNWDAAEDGRLRCPASLPPWGAHTDAEAMATMDSNVVLRMKAFVVNFMWIKLLFVRGFRVAHVQSRLGVI
jgi:hypothetical protein